MKKNLSTSQSGFIDPVSLITFGLLVAGLIISTAIVKNRNLNLNPQKQAAVTYCPDGDCETVVIKLPSPSPQPATASQTQPATAAPTTTELPCLDPCSADSDCGQNEQCYQPASGCPVCQAKPVTAAPAAAEEPAAPPPAANLCLDPCQSDSECGYNQYCYKPASGCPVCKQKSTLCTPGYKQCSGNYLQVCNQQGTSWQNQDCGSVGCNSTTKVCNPAVVPVTKPEACQNYACPDNYTAMVNDYGGCYCQSSDGKAVTPVAKPEQLNNLLKAFGIECVNNSECQSGNCASRYIAPDFRDVILLKKACVYSLAEQNAFLARKGERDAQAATAALTAAIGGNLVTQPLKTIATANFADDAATLIACFGGDHTMCAYAIPSLANPIPGMSYADDLQDMFNVWKTSSTPTVKTSWWDPIGDTADLSFSNVDAPTTSISDALNSLDNPLSSERILNSLNQDGVLDLTPLSGESTITLYKGLYAAYEDVCPTCFTRSIHLNPKDVIEERLQTQPLRSFFDEYHYSASSPFSSWTNNLNTAQRYAGDYGKVVSITIPESLVFDVNTLNPKHMFYNDYEFLVPGIVPVSSQTQVIP